MPTSGYGAEAWQTLFWSLFKRSANPVALVDEQRVAVEVNDAMCRLLGVSHDELVGARPDDFLASAEMPLDAEWREVWEIGGVHGERSVIAAGGARVRVQYALQKVDLGEDQVAVAVFLGVEPDDEDEPVAVAQLGELTPREREVVSLVALGNTSVQIAEQLVISAETVRTHVRNAMAKTGARTRAQLVAIVFSRRGVAIGS
ncbi:MAG TPA: LuxR C-terminal-related transcriptional regulator [Solirubrobacteraceae bacterium]|nr:LuxR C-terminal-related transcriptional regulator [Solirubrobacteraceae bacterium]